MKRIIIETKVYELSEDVYSEFRERIDNIPRVDETIEWDKSLEYAEENGKFLFYIDGDFHY